MSENVVRPSFPCDSLPDDARLAKLIGVYPQRQDGLNLQRVRIPGGRLAGPQWRALGSIARDLTPGTPLHLTTRQDIEIHDLPADRIPMVQHRLVEAGLTGLGGGGDTMRNITVCPCSGVRAGAADLLPLALEIQRVLWSYGRVFELPRKFKVSLSACPQACGQPWINDLGLVAFQRDGAWEFEVVAAGSLGPKPATGLRVFEAIPVNDVLPLALAAVRLFDAHGDRANRSTARLRHVRQRVGDERFLDMLRSEFAAARAERDWPTVALSPAEADLRAAARLTFPNGDIRPDVADSLANLASRADLNVRITSEHQVVLFGRDDHAVRHALEGEPALNSAAQPQPNVVACPGSRWCKRALVNTNQAADSIRAKLAGVLPAGQVIRVSGCPNGCAQSGVAQIGLVGRQTGPAGQREDAFDLQAGGEVGRGPRLAQPVESAVKSTAVPDRLAKLLSDVPAAPAAPAPDVPRGT